VIQRDRQSSQERSTGWHRVVGREELSVGDEPLKDDASQVMGPGHTASDEVFCCFPQAVENCRCSLGRQTSQDARSCVKDWPVVDLKYLLPFVDNRGRSENAISPKLSGWQYTPLARLGIMNLQLGLGQCNVENYRVNKDGHCHSPALSSRIIELAKDLGERRA
jgi:hypothetical protein